MQMQGVGECDSSLRTVSVWVKPPNADELKEEDYQSDYKKGVVYYLDEEDRIVGVLLVGLSESLSSKLTSARKLITKRKKCKDVMAIQQAIMIEEWNDEEVI